MESEVVGSSLIETGSCKNGAFREAWKKDVVRALMSMEISFDRGEISHELFDSVDGIAAIAWYKDFLCIFRFLSRNNFQEIPLSLNIYTGSIINPNDREELIQMEVGPLETDAPIHAIWNKSLPAPVVCSPISLEDFPDDGLGKLGFGIVKSKVENLYNGFMQLRVLD